MHRAAVTLVLLAAACDGTPGWPEWPADEASARALVAERTRREVRDEAPLSADAIVSALDRAAERGTLRAGWRPIAEALREHRVVLVGVHHDAAAHVRAYGRLFGPAGTADDRLLAIELLDGSGRWRGVPENEQSGDDGALLALERRADAESVRALRERIALGAYTAWKYDYLDEVLELAVLARGAGQPLRGCDVPPGLSRRLEALAEATRLRLRELHCALALRELGHERAAILYGDAHLAPEGLARFFDEPPARVHVVGGRPSDAGLEPALAERLAVTDPVLVPLGAQRFVLVLPDARLRAAGDRSRVALDAPEARPRLVASSAAAGELRAGAVRLALSEAERSAPIAPGAHAFVVRDGARRLAGALPIDPGGSAELFVDPASRRVDLRLASPEEAPPGSVR